MSWFWSGAMPGLMMGLSILVPLLATAGIIAARRNSTVRETVTIVASLALLCLVFGVYAAFKQGVLASVTWWEPLPGLAIAFKVEALGLLFALVAAVLWPVTSMYSIGYMRGHQEKNQTRFYACFAVALSAVMGIAWSANLFTLFIFYEVLTLSTYPLVTHAGTEEARRGGRTYLGMLLGSSIAFFLLAIVGTWQVAGTLDFKPGGILGDEVTKTVAGILLVLYLFGIGKAALMPLHGWLPAAMVAPTPVSALLHAVAVVKAGVFTVLKVCVFVFGIDLLAVLPATQGMIYLAGASILLASLMAMRQDNLKKRLAYSTVSQLGYITLGALLATGHAVAGSAMHIATHAFGKITLFFCAGAILVAAHKSKVSEMRGLGRQMPVTMAAFFIASLGIIGAPPAGGTWSKWYLMLGTLEAGQILLLGVLIASALLNIAYLLPIPVLAFLPGTPDPLDDGSIKGGRIKEAPWPSVLALSFTALCCIALFLYPQPLYELASSVLGATR